MCVCVRMLMKVLKGFCTLDHVEIAPPAPSLPPSLPPPPPPTPTFTPAKIVVEFLFKAYRKLLERRILHIPANDNSAHTNVMVLNPSFDHLNIVETAALIAIKAIGNCHDPLATVSNRVVLCACLALSCKAAVDYDAFPGVKRTIHYNTILAVVYHTIFGEFVAFGKLERNPYWLHDLLTMTEINILGCAGDDLFRFCNETHSELFELVLCHVAAADPPEYDVGRIAIRNTVKYYVLAMLGGGASSRLRRVANARPTPDVLNALGAIAVASINVVSADGSTVFSLSSTVRAWADGSLRAHQALALEIVDSVASMMGTRPDLRAFEDDRLCGPIVLKRTMLLVSARLAAGTVGD